MQHHFKQNHLITLLNLLIMAISYELIRDTNKAGFRTSPRVGQRYVHESTNILIAYITNDGKQFTMFNRHYLPIERLNHLYLVPTIETITEHINNVCGRDYQLNYFNGEYTFTFNDTTIFIKGIDLLTVLCWAFIESCNYTMFINLQQKYSNEAQN